MAAVPAAVPAKRKRESGGWAWLLWDSDIAREKIHVALGPAWMAVLKEALCVRAGEEGEAVKRLREQSSEPLVLSLVDVDVPTVPLLEWCVVRKYKPNAATFEATARGGDMDAVVWLKAQGCPWSEDTCAGAAKGGHLDVLKWLRNEGCPWGSRTCWEAAKGGHLHVLEYAHENGCPWNEGTCAHAAQNGHVAVLEYAHKNGCPWDAGMMCLRAAKRGHVGVLRYAHENWCPWDELTCQAAAEEGHLDVLMYAHENGCPWDEVTCNAAAEIGHLDMLRYAHENGCPWGEVTCFMAAEGGHLEVIQYARENGCPWDKVTCFFNAGNEEVADWISAQLDDEQYEEYVGLDDDELAGGCPCCRDFSNLFSFPGANHNTPAPFQNPFHNKQASPFHMKRC